MTHLTSDSQATLARAQPCGVPGPKPTVPESRYRTRARRRTWAIQVDNSHLARIAKTRLRPQRNVLRRLFPERRFRRWLWLQAQAARVRRAPPGLRRASKRTSRIRTSMLDSLERRGRIR